MWTQAVEESDGEPATAAKVRKVIERRAEPVAPVPLCSPRWRSLSQRVEPEAIYAAT